MNPPEYPTPWQRKTLWTAATGLAAVTLGAIFVGLIWLVSQILGFLQPILIPFAVAGVMAYLLDPVVSRIVSWGWSRHRAVFAVFAVVTLILALVMIWIVPAISEQSVNVARKVPAYTRHAKVMLMNAAKEVHHLQVTVQDTVAANIPQALKIEPPTPDANPPADSEESKTTPADVATTGAANLPATPKTGPDAVKNAGEKPGAEFDIKDLLSDTWLASAMGGAFKHSWSIVRDSLGGFLGVLGFLLSLIIVPIYLYYFLTEAPQIATGWSDYIPLRASAFKDEVVSVLKEINGYLIAFFRGQLVVSLVNGSVTALGLVIAGLDFGLLIGITLCFLGLIPYLGITMCWVLSVLIAALQGGSWCVPAHPWWIFPLVISGVFVVVHNIDGLFVTPKIVGESVGLHPLTVIVSVFVWSLLMGGLLGAILAVPMTATVKVLLRRYVWERRFRAPDSPIIIPDSPPAPLEPATATSAAEPQHIVSPEPLPAR